MDKKSSCLAQEHQNAEVSMPNHPADTVQHGGERETGKRKRRSTGGTFDTPHKTTGNAALCDIEQPNMTKERFRTLPTDEKLVTLFDLMANVGNLTRGSRALSTM